MRVHHTLVVQQFEWMLLLSSVCVSNTIGIRFKSISCSCHGAKHGWRRVARVYIERYGSRPNLIKLSLQHSAPCNVHGVGNASRLLVGVPCQFTCRCMCAQRHSVVANGNSVVDIRWFAAITTLRCVSTLIGMRLKPQRSLVPNSGLSVAGVLLG